MRQTLCVYSNFTQYVTQFSVYTIPMLNFSSQNLFYSFLFSRTALPTSALLSSAWQGFFCLLGLFLFCFLGVHLLILACVGWKYKPIFIKKPLTQNKDVSAQESKNESKNGENKAPTQTAQEPIYYIVERKAKDKNGRYGKPKQIHFK